MLLFVTMNNFRSTRTLGSAPNVNLLRLASLCYPMKIVKIPWVTKIDVMTYLPAVVLAVTMTVREVLKQLVM